VRPRALLPALALLVSVSYGALFYGFSVLITDAAAGARFSTVLLATAYGGAVLTSGLAAVPVGRLADRRGIRGIVALGSILGGLGLTAFSAADAPWQVLAIWWGLLGPAMAMTFYEPAYVAIQQWFEPLERPRAIARLTLAAGLSGPVSIPVAGALVEAVGWQETARMLGGVLAVVGLGTAALVGRGPGAGAGHVPLASPLRSLARRRVAVFTLGGVLAYGALEALIVHRVARFEEAGFGVGTVTVWAAVSGLLTLPGRFVLPALGRRLPGTVLLAGVLLALAAATGFAVIGDTTWQLAAFFCLSGLVFGAALPLRAVVMSGWHGVAGFGAVMGAQTMVIAFARAGGPPLVGGVRDGTGGYALPMVLLTGLFALGAVLVVVSERLES
jgi:predicted MFS family arabinose efflux permease